MIKTITTVRSVSRCAGGMYDGVRLLTQHLAAHDVGSAVYSLYDEFTGADIDQWAEWRPRTCKAVGPYGFSPELMSAVMTDGDADLAHGHGLWSYSGVPVYRWAVHYGRPYMVSPHGMLNPEALKYSRWKKMLYGAFFERKYLAGASCIRALSVSEAESVRKYGLKNPVCIIPNGVDVGGCKIAHGSGGNTHKVLLYLGRLHPGKNLENLIRAWFSALEEKKGLSEEWRLVMAGRCYAGYEMKLRRLANSLGLGESASFPGAKYGDDKDAIYDSASAFVLPSLFEGLPISLLEAWARGLPVVMTPECNLPEGYERGAAIMIDTGIRSITDGILQTVAMADGQRAGMGLKGRELVTEKYSWRDIASKMKQVYAWMLGGGVRPDCVWQG